MKEIGTLREIGAVIGDFVENLMDIRRYRIDRSPDEIGPVYATEVDKNNKPKGKNSPKVLDADAGKFRRIVLNTSQQLRGTGK